MQFLMAQVSVLIPKPPPNTACFSLYCFSGEDTNDKRISISKVLPKTRICIKYSKSFLNNLVGILHACGLENILGSSVGVNSNGVTFATFLSMC